MPNLKNLNPAAAVQAALPLALAAGLGLTPVNTQNGKTYFLPKAEANFSMVSISPDGRTIATVAEGERSAKLWSDQGGFKRNGKLQANQSLVSVGVGDSGWIAVNGPASMNLWRNGKVVYGPFSGDFWVKTESFYQFRRVVFGRSIISLATGSETGGTIERTLATTPQMGSINISAFSSDGKSIVTAHRGTTYGNPSPDHEISNKDNTARLWKASDGSLLRTFSGHTDSVTDASLSRNGKILATASFDKTAKLWDSDNGSLLFTLTGHTDRVRSIRFSFDGSLVVTASDDGTAKVWNVATGALVSTTATQVSKTSGRIDPAMVALFPYRNSNTVITAYAYGEAKMWNGDTGQPY